MCTFEDVLRCDVEGCECFPEDRGLPLKCGERVLIWGDHFGASDSAEKLAAEGKKVYVVTENREFAQWMEPCHRDVMMKRFACGNGEGLKDKRFDQPVTIITGTTVTEIGEDGQVKLLDQSFNQSSLAVDNVVLASVASDNSFYEELIQAGVTAVRIGDLKRPRNLLAAVREGANAGLTLDEDLMLNANHAPISRLPAEVRLS